MERLKNIVEKRDTHEGRIFDVIIQIVIFISIFTFSLETLPNLTTFEKEILHFVEVSCIIIFCIEYILRILVAEKKLDFIFSFYGIIDLLAIIPFIFLHIDTSAVRAFHFLRFFRIFKLARYTRVFVRFQLALKYAKEELILFFSATIILIYLSSVGIYFFEHETQPEIFSSIFDCFWWSLITLTTVGYGDLIPITIGGKVFTFFILLIGIGIIALPAGIISSALSKARSEMETIEKERKRHGKTL